jgi:hypothetical protein
MDVSIQGLSPAGSNYDFNALIGQYVNTEDPTEVVQQYRFNLYDSLNNLVETSGWQPHNHYGDPIEGQSQDTYTLRKVLTGDNIYRIKYIVQTNSYAEAESPMYTLIAGSGVPSDIVTPLEADLDYDNACIKIHFAHSFAANSGNYEFARASSKDNFSSWTVLFNFTLNSEVTSGRVFYTDYWIEHGVTYRYSVRQYNSRGLYSRRGVTLDTTAYFEDLFLWDGERQLRVRFNPKITNFKRTVSEAKKNTIGAMYPKFFRNGTIDYKEFQVSGLISYLMDNDGYFYSRTELGYPDHEDETDITDENLALERRFNMATLHWLSDGHPKLLKSPGEGNYIVYLMNTSLTPNDSVSRMLHTFQTNATECGDAESLDDMEYLDIIKDPEIHSEEEGQISYYTVSLLEKVVGDHIYVGKGAHYLRFENVVPGTTFQVSYDDEHGLGHMTTIMIGATGYYELKLDDGAVIRDIIINYMPVQHNIYERLYNGVITIGAKIASDFNGVNMATLRNIPAWYTPGWGMNNNLLDALLPIARLYRIRLTRVTDIENIQTLDASSNKWHNAYTLYHCQNSYWRFTDILPYHCLNKSGSESYYSGYDARMAISPASFHPDWDGQWSAGFCSTGGSMINYNVKIVTSHGDIDLNLETLTGVYDLQDWDEVPSAIYAGNGVNVEIACQVQEVIYDSEPENDNDTIGRCEKRYNEYAAAKAALDEFLAYSDSPKSWYNLVESYVNDHPGVEELAGQPIRDYAFKAYFNKLRLPYNIALHNYVTELKTHYNELEAAHSVVNSYWPEVRTPDNNFLYHSGKTYGDSGKKPTRIQGYE